MKIKSQIQYGAQAAVLMLAASNASAGSIGFISSDDTTVKLGIPDIVRISDVGNIDLGDYNGVDSTMEGSASYCVFRNGAGAYRLKATTDHGDYVVESKKSKETIPFVARIDSDADASDGDTLAYGAFTNNMNGSERLNCNGQDNGSIHVTFEQDDLLEVSPQNDYQAVVTIMVEPV